MKVSAKKGLATADMIKALRILRKHDLFYIPVTAGEAKRMQRTFQDHLCTRPPEKCKVCKARVWFTEAWNKRCRIVPFPAKTMRFSMEKNSK